VDAKTKILESADSLFGEAGFDATTTRQIAERSGVNKALIHYHFSTKEKLFGSVLDQYYEQLGQTLVPALAEGGSVRDRLAGMIDVYVDFLAANRSFSRMIQREASGGKFFDRIVGHMTPLFQTGVALVHEAYPSTRGGDLDATHLLLSFYGMIVSTFTYGPIVTELTGTDALAGPGLEQRKAHLKRMLDLILETLAAEEASER
jgi:TetR/AcrR family transcriptional regulator